MDRIKIGIPKEYAIIVKQVSDTGTTYEAFELLEGHFITEDDIFVGEDENCYYHFSDYSPANKKEKYFLGHFEVTDYLSKVITENYEAFKSDYLDKFKKFHFQCRSEGIICVDKETNKKSEYYDHVVENSIHIESEIKEQLTTILEGLNEQINEELSAQFAAVEELENKSYEVDIKQTPSEIVSEVLQYVKGQDKAVKSIVTNVYQFLKFKNGIKNNMFIVGPTGVGKTYIFEVLSKILDVPLLIYSIAGLTQTGYIGKSVDDILTQLIASCNGDVKKAEHAIVVFDEIDKIAFKDDSTKSTMGDEAVQNELLKIIEGDKRLVAVGQGHEKEEVEIDTTNIIFAGAGAFQKIFTEKPKKSLGFGSEIYPEKKPPKLTGDVLTQNGIKAEMIGRMPIIIQLRNLEEQDLCNIITDSKGSALKKVENLITEECGIKITNLDELVHKIAKDAISRNVGARGIKSTIANLMEVVYFEIFNNFGQYEELTFGPNFTTDPTDFTLTKKTNVKVKKRIPPKGINNICEN